jgi:DNA polymerase-1
VNQFFDKLEIKALKARVAPFAKDGQVKEIAAKKVSVREVNRVEFEKALTSSTGLLGLLLSESQAAISVEPEAVLVAEIGQVADVISSFTGFIFHGAKQAISSKVLSAVAIDTEVAAYLINAGSREIALSDLLQKYLGIELDNSPGDLFTSGWDPSVTCYLQELWRALSKELEAMSCLDLYNQIEMPTMHVLAAMEATGIAIDSKEMKSLLDFFGKEEAEATSLAYKEVGHEFNAASPKQLQVVLFEELKLPKTKKIKTGFSTDAESLEWLFSTTKHPVLASLLRIREVGKLRTTVEGLLNSTKADSRIHTTFQQTTTATGRLSSTEPNLQNIPIRSDEGRRIRNCFIAQEPFVDLLTADYSQIEMRIMAHLSDDKGLLEAFRTGEDLHSTVGAQVFDVPVSKVDADMRRQIKAMSYGLAYGLSSYGLANQLDISPTDASILMSKYFERFGGIQDYLKEVVKIAREKGYTETILGRRRYLPDLNHENRGRREMAERMALNAPIQGSAADIIKVAMLNVEKAMRSENLATRLLIQVHDELIF